MPEILLPSSTSILSSSSSTASSLLAYNHPGTGPQHSLSRRKSLPLRRISGWQWLSRRISRQGLNATHDGVYNHTHTHSHSHHDYHHDVHDDDYENEKMISSPQRRKTLAFETNYDYEKAQEQERDIAESYAAYCRAFTSAGLHQYQHQHGHKRKMWMMDGLVDQSSLEDSNEMRLHTVHVHAENDDACVDEKRETSEAEVQLAAQPQPVLPPPQILTPSLYAEMRRAACDKKRARLRQRRLWSWSWFPQIRQRES
ncbi:hypothetical protein CNMCM5793_007865 [Aspergillus hiratsukae]|uniref:Uncharacterized protein n=1 Tax=Aspergillus hiratsukae TaxID=1194566 RepID=A0A8H6P629_9EURO|nr:hypothetical protein CNMCM5793_007865 [Aspergillus hiratsukae]KAF7172857.1 hypothetical protein CNMCM6106_006952 [Aspergillus hiratsukae]